ncbi:hypothetical protein PI124_g11375 [Phytophthora idaei]|nr:hypothetical protein PI125_g9662 [Phytophthora idaei]KAG3153318.1 hypothetical protein PI126_g10125 [Phytophthora idaei]KAG3243804.1 hypothetical protein PI124_g11375 [Phytophthora idaei]
MDVLESSVFVGLVPGGVSGQVGERWPEVGDLPDSSTSGDKGVAIAVGEHCLEGGGIYASGGGEDKRRWSYME